MDVEIDTKCCRTCLEATADNFIFDNPELLKKLEFTTSLRINAGDGLPIYFCNSCQKKLEVSYQFRLQSIRSYKYLKNHINQIRNQFNSIVKSNSDVRVDKNDMICFLNTSQTNSTLIRPQKKETVDLVEINDFEQSEQTDSLHSKVKPKSLKNKKKNKKNDISSDDGLKMDSNKVSKINKNVKKVNKTSNEDVFCENDGVEFSKCDICQKMFRKGNLKRHRQTHVDDKKFLCEICNKSFTQKSSLQRHHLIHTGVKPYKCKTCEKCFSQSKTLKFHMALHGEDKTYNCSVCRYRFIKAENLANHMREKHSSGNTDDVVLFVCQFCNKGFKSKYSLKVHKEKLHKDDIVFDMDWSDINDEDSDDTE